MLLMCPNVTNQGLEVTFYSQMTNNNNVHVTNKEHKSYTAGLYLQGRW